MATGTLYMLEKEEKCNHSSLERKRAEIGSRTFIFFISDKYVLDIHNMLCIILSKCIAET